MNAPRAKDGIRACDPVIEECGLVGEAGDQKPSVTSAVRQRPPQNMQIKNIWIWVFVKGKEFYWLL